MAKPRNGFVRPGEKSAYFDSGWRFSQQQSAPTRPETGLSNNHVAAIALAKDTAFDMRRLQFAAAPRSPRPRAIVPTEPYTGCRLALKTPITT